MAATLGDVPDEPDDPEGPPDEDQEPLAAAALILQDREVYEVALAVLRDFHESLSSAPTVEEHDRTAAMNLVGAGAAFFYCLASWLEGMDPAMRPLREQSIISMAREHAEKLQEIAAKREGGPFEA